MHQVYFTYYFVLILTIILVPLPLPVNENLLISFHLHLFLSKITLASTVHQTRWTNALKFRWFIPHRESERVYVFCLFFVIIVSHAYTPNGVIYTNFVKPKKLMATRSSSRAIKFLAGVSR